MNKVLKKVIPALLAAVFVTLSVVSLGFAETNTGITTSKTAEWTGDDTIQIVVDEAKGTADSPTILFLVCAPWARSNG